MALYRFYIKSPDQARDLFRDWKKCMGVPQKREDTYIEFGEYFWIELDTETLLWRIVPKSGR